MKLQRLILMLLLAVAVQFSAGTARAAQVSPAESAESIRADLVQAQLALTSDPQAASGLVRKAEAAYRAGMMLTLGQSAPEANQRTLSGFASLSASLTEGNPVTFAGARAQVWTAILAGSAQSVEKAIQQGDGPMARQWLPVREFRVTTRFTRPNAEATIAVNDFINGSVNSADAILSIRADLLDTYQARLTKSLQDLASADVNGYASRRAELAAAAQGYFLILAPAYATQRGADALTSANATFASLRAESVNGQGLSNILEQTNATLRNFRAAPLSPAEQSRRAGQLLRFLSLVPVEYGRGVVDGRVTRDFEIQEAQTFHAGAYAAFSDLENLLNPANAQQAKAAFDALGKQLTDAGTGAAITNPDAIQSQSDALTTLLKEAMPESWLQGSTQGDFDVIASMLDQMENAVHNREYDLAESARLEAYAIMEIGPEARLMVFAPQLKLRLEELFWNGQGKEKGLAHLIKNEAAITEIKSTRAELDKSLVEAQTTLGKNSEPAAIATNAGLIVFREGLEAVLILASLMSSMKRKEEQKYRKPMWIGTGAALLATVLTWMLARGVLQSLARYGERLEAIVSLIAIGVLLLILNWFFHKKYWTGWIASFHSKKKQIITGEAGLWLGLITLGFTSVYREGFETVLFLQALVLEGGTTMVMIGIAAAMLAVVLVGLVTFKLQVNLPYRNMLIVTGVLIAGVLLQMVGNTVHVLQVLGWLPIHLIEGISLPFWLGTWFGVYATWEGIILQVVATTYVVGSYYLAEWLQKRNLKANASQQPASLPQTAPVRQHEPNAHLL